MVIPRSPKVIYVTNACLNSRWYPQLYFSFVFFRALFILVQNPIFSSQSTYTIFAHLLQHITSLTNGDHQVISKLVCNFLLSSKHISNCKKCQGIYFFWKLLSSFRENLCWSRSNMEVKKARLWSLGCVLRFYLRLTFYLLNSNSLSASEIKTETW